MKLIKNKKAQDAPKWLIVIAWIMGAIVIGIAIYGTIRAFT